MSKNDVLFINTPPHSINALKNDVTSASFIFPPLGILCLADRLLKNCSVGKIKCLDYSLYDYSKFSSISDYKHAISDYLNEFLNENDMEPYFICISLMFSSSYDFFRLIVEAIRENIKNCIIICGGIHATNAAEFLLRNDSIDYVVCGEGEEVLPQLINNISHNIFDDITSVYNKDKIINQSEIKVANVVNNIEVNFKTYPQIINMEEYINRTSLFSLSSKSILSKSFSVMASRGCPVSCTFCSAHTVHGKRPRWRDIESIKEEIIWLYERYGVNKIYLMDDNYIPKNKAIELFTMFSKLNIPDLDIVIQNMSVNHTDYEIIDAIQNANIKYIPFAIETGSPDMQQKIKKYCDLEKAIELVAYCRQKCINVRCFYIIGFPGETVEHMQKTIDFAVKVKADWSNFNVAVPLPGSEMYSEFVKLGYIKDSPEFWEAATIRDRVFDTPEISAKDIKELAYTANLKVNFINNPLIFEGKLKDAEIIFKNFISSFDFHIFAYDALKRIYEKLGEYDKKNEILFKMKELILNNEKSKEFKKYFYMLDEDTNNFLSS